MRVRQLTANDYKLMQRSQRSRMRQRMESENYRQFIGKTGLKNSGKLTGKLRGSAVADGQERSDKSLAPEQHESIAAEDARSIVRSLRLKTAGTIVVLLYIIAHLA